MKPRVYAAAAAVGIALTLMPATVQATPPKQVFSQTAPRQASQVAPTTAVPIQPTPRQPDDEELRLPSADLLRPIIPDLSPETIPGRVSRILRLLMGLLGFSVLGYGIYRFFVLAWEAMAGKLAIRTIVERLVIYGISFGVVFMLLGGSMYSLLVDVYTFLSHSGS